MYANNESTCNKQTSNSDSSSSFSSSSNILKINITGTSSISVQDNQSSTTISSHNTITCVIGCGDAVVTCPNSLHHFCSDCFQNMIGTQIHETGSSTQSYCFIADCSSSGNFFDMKCVIQHVSPALNVELIYKTIRFREKNRAESERKMTEIEIAEAAKRTKKENDIHQLRLRLEHMANKTCGKCGVTWYDFDGCCAVHCNKCPACICAYCEQVFDNDVACHIHIMHCKWNPTKQLYPSNKAIVFELNRKCKAPKIQKELRKLDKRTRKLAEKDPVIATILKDHFIPISSSSKSTQNNINRENTQTMMEPMISNCLNSHNLIGFTLAEIGFRCDGCNLPQLIGTRMSQCEKCGDIICQRCELRLQSDLSESNAIIDLASASTITQPSTSSIPASNPNIIEGEIYKVLWKQSSISGIGLHHTSANEWLHRVAIAQQRISELYVKFIYIDDVGGEEIINVVDEIGRITKFTN